jgi:membrane-associated phospholipid phosphatase
MHRSTRALLGMAAASMAGFALVALAAYETAAGRWLDRVGLEGFLAMPNGLLQDLARTAVQLGDPAQVGLLGLALAAVAVARGRPRVALSIVVLLAATSVSSQLLKDLLAHPRLQPIIAGGHVRASSLPSGHSTAAMALALAAVFAAPRRARPAAAVIGAALALVVGFSVVSLGWHFPSDVIAGFLLATGWAVTLAAGLREADRRWPAHRRAGRRAAWTTVAERASASGITVAAIAISLITVTVALLALVTHSRELADFGRDRTTTVAIVAGMACSALAFPAAVAAALRRV